MKKIRIVVNNHKSKMFGDTKTIDSLRDLTKIKSDGYFFSKAWRERRWDGYVRYITDGGQFSTGLLPDMLAQLKYLGGIEVTIEDNREHFRPIKEIKMVGKLKLRPYQLASVTSVKDHEVAGLKFPRGILHEATNAGKSLIAAALYKSYNSKRVAVLLINNTEIHKQLVEEISELLGKDIVGTVSSKTIQWKKFNICMVQTLANRIVKNPTIRRDVSQADIIMVDEADEVINRKDCQKVLMIAAEAPIRIALTGTALKNKDKIKNQKLIEFFGPVIHHTSNVDLIAQGVSTPPVITFFRGNDEVTEASSYDQEYSLGIIRNRRRHLRIWKRVAKRIEQNRFPILILVRYREHIKRLLKAMPEALKNNTIASVHGDTPNRDTIFKRFKDNRLDILISSMIIKRGKNLPTIKTLINAAGGDSEATILQILGRSLRSHKSKKKVYVDEFFDRGKYLRRHSRHRINYYKNDGHEVKEPYKKFINKYN